MIAAALAVVGLPAAAAHAAAKPDLVVASIGAAPQAPQLQGHAFGISETTRNRGTGGAGRTHTGFWLSKDRLRGAGDLRLPPRAVPVLAAGGQSTATSRLTIPLNATPDLYYVIACADAAREAAESAEANNCRATASRLLVTPRPTTELRASGKPRTPNAPADPPSGRLPPRSKGSAALRRPR